MFAASLTFTTRLGEPEDGYFTLSASELLAANTKTYKVGYSIIDPTGATIKAMPVSHDFTFLGGAGNSDMTVLLPKGVDGKYIQGDYKVSVRYYFTDGGGDSAPTTLQRTYYWTPVVAPGSGIGLDVDLSGTASCVNGLIKAVDKTDYTGRVITSRSLTLKPPTVTGQPTPANTVGSSTVNADLLVQTTTLYDNVEWTATLDVVWGSLSAGTIEVILDVRTINSIVVTVSCQLDYCSLANCMEIDFLAFETKTCGTGGFGSLSSVEIGNMLYKGQLFQLGFMKQKCGDMVSAKSYFDKLKALSADCGCGCEGTTEPVKFVAWT